MKIFISYATDDKEFAGELKRGLGDYGLFAFLAHEDIRPSEEWQKEIIAHLQTCDVFIPIISDAFKLSDWTDQEAGYALARDILIIPIKYGLIPYGFINKYQAFTFKGKTVFYNPYEDLIKLIGSKITDKDKLINALIRSLYESFTFDEAARKAKFICNFEPFTKKQINKIIKASVDNNQIYQSFGARDYLRPLVRKYKDLLDSDLIEEFSRLTRR